jgi:hypothetical protein
MSQNDESTTEMSKQNFTSSDETRLTSLTMLERETRKGCESMEKSCRDLKDSIQDFTERLKFS